MTTFLILAVLAAPDAGQAMVFVIEPDGSQSLAAAKLEVTLTDALTAQNVRLADADTLFAQPEPINPGDALFDAGHQALESLDLDTAKAKLTDALAAYAEVPATTTAERLADVGVALASVASQSGDKSQQRVLQNRLTSALLFNPMLAPSPSLFGPELPKLMEKVRAELEARPKGTLTVEATPGAEVLIRGELRRAPIDPLKDLPLGLHFVSANKPGHRPRAAIVEVKANGTSLELKNQPTKSLARARKAAGGLLSSGLPAGVRALATSVQSRYLIVANAKTGAVTVFDSQGTSTLKDLSLTSGTESAAQVAQRVKKFIEGPSAMGMTQNAGPQATRESVAGKWWFWVAVGGAAVAAGATVGIVAASTGPKRGFNPVLGF